MIPTNTEESANLWIDNTNTNYQTMADNLEKQKQKVCIIGGGAAGIAAAWSLHRFPDQFEVQLWEKEKVAGGQATSENIAKVNSFINDGVQGGPYSYRNTLALHKILGFEPHPVNMKISFGKGESNWTNYSKTKLVEDLASDIKRFGQF